MRGFAATLALLVAAVVTAGCAPTRMARAPDVLLDSRQLAVAAFDPWSADGRISFSFDDRNASSRMLWRQRGGDFSIDLRAPAAGGSWRLSANASGALLEGAGPEPLRNADADTLLAQKINWPLPIAVIRAWLRGLPYGADAQVRWDSAGLPATIVDQGWRIEYRRWQPAAAGAPAMPSLIVARRGEDDFRVAVSRWGDGDGGD